MTEYLCPTTVDEAVRALAEHSDFAVVAGGTDLLVAANKHFKPNGVINVFGLEEMTGVTWSDEFVFIGGATTYLSLIENEKLKTLFPLIKDAASEIGALQIQARGTVGGNIGTSSPVGDSLPVWLALDAEIQLVSVGGERWVPYSEFCTGYRKTSRNPDELITKLRIPLGRSKSVMGWRKVGPRKAQSISKVMFAGSMFMENGRCQSPRFAFGAVADRPIRLLDVEAECNGKSLDQETIERALETAKATISPIDDVRSSAEYRKYVAVQLLEEFLLRGKS